MRNISIALTLFALVFTMGCSSKPAETKAENKATANLSIEGMTCREGCAKRIETTLSGMEGITSCVVDFDNKTARVEFDSELYDADKIGSTISEMGDYEVKTLSVEGAAKNTDESGEEEDENGRETVQSIEPGSFFPRLFILVGTDY